MTGKRGTLLKRIRPAKFANDVNGVKIVNNRMTIE